MLVALRKPFYILSEYNIQFLVFIIALTFIYICDHSQVVTHVTGS